jgi:hypothetical protein
MALSIKGGVRLRLSLAALDVFCYELKPSRKELASVDVLSRTALKVFHRGTFDSIFEEAAADCELVGVVGI